METILIALIIFVASFIQGVFGFAFVLIAVPVLSYFLDSKVAVTLATLFFTTLSLIFMVRCRRHVDLKKIMPLMIGALLGIPIGILYFLEFNEHIVKLILGVVLIIYSLYFLFNQKSRVRLPDASAYLFGFFSGSLGGAFNMTGPPILIYLSTKRWSKEKIYGSLYFFYFITSVMILILLVLGGHMNQKIFVTFVELLPVMVVGTFIGFKCFSRMQDEKYKKALYYLLIIMGVILLL